MRTSLSLGLSALLGIASSALGCASDDDDTTSAAGSSGASSAQGGTAGGTGSGGTNGATGGTDTASGGTANGEAGTSSDGGAGTSSTDAGAPNGDMNAGASGATDVTPYANVVAVKTSSNADAYTFSVTVESADIDCTQYANWWEVLTEDGALSYRRILDHSHTDANGSSDPDEPGNTFTRAGGPVLVSADDVVLVRAHMSTGGYNGMVMRGSVADGFTQAIDIDGNFAADVEFQEPLPTSCEF